MKYTVFFYITILFLSLASCDGKNQEKTSADSIGAIATDSISSEELVPDSLKAGRGTKSSTPAEPGSGTSTSENGLSTDVRGVVSKDTVKENK